MHPKILLLYQNADLQKFVAGKKIMRKNVKTYFSGEKNFLGQIVWQLAGGSQ